MAQKVAGELYEGITGQLFEIGLQLRQESGYPYNPLDLRIHLEAAIAGSFHISPKILKPWKTVQVGTGLKTAVDIYRALKGNGFKVVSWAENFICRQSFIESISPVRKGLTLYTASTGELIGRPGTLKEIFASIERIGGKLLPSEAGPQLRLQYPDQPADECLQIAMEQIMDAEGELHVWVVKNEDGRLYLTTHFGYPETIFGLEGRWVFAMENEA